MTYTQDEADILSSNGFEMHNVTTITDTHCKFVLGKYTIYDVFNPVITLKDAERKAANILQNYIPQPQRFNFDS